MIRPLHWIRLGLLAIALPGGAALAQDRPAEPADRDFVSLFDGVSLEHWVVGRGSEGHWRVADGVIDYDGKSEAAGRSEVNLWTRQWFSDFTVRFEWRFSGPVYEILAADYQLDGTIARNPDGSIRQAPLRSAGDSGVLLRGYGKLQINLGNLLLAGSPEGMGSGAVWGFFTDTTLAVETRRLCRPARNADRPYGEWNAVEITVVENTVTVINNGVTVIDHVELPRLPYAGPIGLQHHGLGPIIGAPRGQTHVPTRLQFRNLRIREY